MDPADFIRAEAGRPFRWGETDCAATVDRWIAMVTGRSPLAAFGRRHADAGEAAAWLAEPGGLPKAVKHVLSAAGLEETAEPRPGDVGLVVQAGKVCVAIFSGHLWFTRDESGLMAAPPEACLKAWRVG